jgi:hypothetical protein
MASACTFRLDISGLAVVTYLDYHSTRRPCIYYRRSRDFQWRPVLAGPDSPLGPIPPPRLGTRSNGSLQIVDLQADGRGARSLDDVDYGHDVFILFTFWGLDVNRSIRPAFQHTLELFLKLGDWHCLRV